MKIYGACDNCKKKAWFVRKRSFPVPAMKLKAKSKWQLCNTCYKKLNDVLK